MTHFLEFLALVIAGLIMALPWLVWIKLLALSLDSKISGWWVILGLLIAIPLYYKIIDTLLLGGKMYGG